MPITTLPLTRPHASSVVRVSLQKLEFVFVLIALAGLLTRQRPIQTYCFDLDHMS